ncbi:hypothetical protein, conserved [Eimeria tenella]|uniref:Uncharacterized protein n=1 Tax=Eimeria tenella TaxID=5802 RepID=U6LA89_EIMTE|nr:hypothetical protein, conserved [Eimeria tenella]CDJ45444.1 hypothetical protein, conserved [Eimeria tenella]|eukprot:XP_013236190.1 hypothetical protein, conserved [Eimeria tenella]
MARKGPPTPGSLSRGSLEDHNDGSPAGLSEGLPGGPSSQLNSRLALVRYLLYQVRTSRSAYYPESSSVGGDPTSGAAFGHIWGASEKAAGDSAADIAAAGAAGLADALDPSVPVSVLLQSVAVPKLPPDVAASDCPLAPASSPPRGPAAAAAAASWPSWGSLAAATTATASHEGYEALELYLCERLLPLLDSALAALCNFVEKLQADTNQYEQHQQHLQQQQQQQQRRRLLQEQQQDDEGQEQQPQVAAELDIQQQEGEGKGERQHHQAQHDRDEQPQQPDTNSVEERVPTPRLLLGKGLKARFDPLVWLAQYLLRHSKAADKYEAATSSSSSSSTAAAATATITVRRDAPKNGKAAAPEAAARVVRGEHLCHSELPLLAAVARQVREERNWRALEAVKPQMQIYVENYLQQQRQQEQQEHDPQGLEKNGHEGEGEYSQRQQLKKLHRQQEQQQQQQHPDQQQQDQCPLTVEDLHFALQALDTLWGLDEQHGLFAAVAGADDETETDPWSLPSSSRGSSHSSRMLLLPLHDPSHTNSANNNNSASSNGIIGACSGVLLEVADSNNITFPEFWRFIDACLLACPPVKQAAFNYAFQRLAKARRQQEQQDKQQQEQRQQQQQLEQLVQQQQEEISQQQLRQDQEMLQEEAEVESGLSSDVLPSQKSSENETQETEHQEHQQQ